MVHILNLSHHVFVMSTAIVCEDTMKKRLVHVTYHAIHQSNKTDIEGWKIIVA